MADSNSSPRGQIPDQMTIRSHIRRFLDGFVPPSLVVHFSYHKCLTVYYQKVMSKLSSEFGLRWMDYNDDVREFHRGAVEGSGRRVLVLNNRDEIQWDRLPSYRGSHFIRDPRDMVVSGYRYHLWCAETWCTSPDFDWDRYAPPAQFALVGSDPDRRPRGISYQAYLRSLDPEQGMILEIVFFHWIFAQLRTWNYGNPRVLELRYEDIIGHEADAFARLFDHYGFERRLKRRGVEIATKLSLENQRKGEGHHVRSGEARQWAGEFTPTVKAAFKALQGDLLIRLGYEKDLEW